MVTGFSIGITQNSQSAENNTSNVTISLTITWNGGSYNATGNAAGVLTIDGTAYDFKTVFNTAQKTSGSEVIYSKTLTVAHNSDGSKTLPCSASFATGTAVGMVEASATKTLTPIPRESTIGATDANIGSTSVISVNRKNGSYTHSIAYQFGSLHGYLADGGGTHSDLEARLTDVSLAFPISECFYTQIPNASSSLCTLTIKTYSGSKQIGSDKTCSFRVTAAEDACRPVVSGTVVDVNEDTLALTGDEKVLIKGMSTALCTMTAEARNGATLKSRTIGGVVVTEDERTIRNIELNEVVFTATDSREYVGIHKEPLTMVEYIPLTCNVIAKRTDPTSGNVSLAIDGKYFKGSFGAVDNKLEVRCSIGSDEWLDLEPQIGENSFAVHTVLKGLDYQSSHSITVEISDKLMTLTKTATVGKGIPVFDWGENDFVFHVPVSILGVELDHVVEAGTSGIWSYEKWLSGKSVCWGILGTDTESGAGSSTFGDASVAYSSRTIDFPDIFMETPIVFVSPNDSGLGLVSAENDGSTAEACKVAIYGASTAIGSASVYAIGKWK